MNHNLTEIVFILDRSGSMSHLQADTIGGYNSFLDEQKRQTGEAHVTTVLFDDGYSVLHDHLPIHSVSPITARDYIPVGMTALYDAVGRTIASVGKRLSETAEEDRPSKVIFVITTDGEENCSHEYTGDKVKEMIEHQKSKYSWEFLFIGAGIDAYHSASSIGIDSIHTASYAATTDGLVNTYSSASKAVCSIMRGELATDWKNDAAEISGVPL